MFVQGSLHRILVLPAGIQNAELCTEQTQWWEVEAWKWPYNHYNVIGRKIRLLISCKHKWRFSQPGVSRKVLDGKTSGGWVLKKGVYKANTKEYF